MKKAAEGDVKKEGVRFTRMIVGQPILVHTSRPW